jgi:Zn-dependent protease/predicted transcriptional regulator
VSRTALEVGRIGGVRIRLDASLVLALPLLAWAVASGFEAAARLAGVDAARIPGPRWAWGLGLAVALFASVLLHELAHCWVLVRRGGRVGGVTLSLIGGATEMAAPPRDARHEAGIALAGPAASLALGLAAGALSILALRRGATGPGFALSYLGRLNVGLALFNLLPAFPMDGGRVLRAWLLRRRSAVEATRTAANLGKAFAAAFAALGFVSSNLVLLLVAFVVFAGATAEEQGVVVQAVLGELRVEDVMTASPVTVGPEASLREVAARMVHGRRVALPVCDGARPLGLVRLQRVERTPAERRRATLARDAMEPAPTVSPGAPALDALRLLGAGRADHVLVVEDGALVGILAAFDLQRALRLHRLAASEAGPPG